MLPWKLRVEQRHRSQSQPVPNWPV